MAEHKEYMNRKQLQTGRDNCLLCVPFDERYPQTGKHTWQKWNSLLAVCVILLMFGAARRADFA